MIAKVEKNNNISQSTQTGGYLFNTLAHLDQTPSKQLDNSKLQKLEDSKKNYQNRARAKAITNSYLFDLIDLNNKMSSSYWSTFHCSNVILQDNNRAKAKYCKQRWCIVCNRIRTAKIINDYKPEIDKFKAPQFVTLTLPNVKAKELKKTIEKMNTTFSNITRKLKREKHTIKALRKYECTYNKTTNEYHPHYHILIDNKETGEAIINQWLKNVPTANRVAQDIRPANETSLIELCKYFTKIVAKDTDTVPKALDIMFRAIRNKRTFQAIGIRSASTKTIDEEFTELEAQEINHKEDKQEIYVWKQSIYDWVAASGEIFAEYKPTATDMQVLSKQKKLKPKLQEIGKKGIILTTPI
jgi:hypothetical protein